ncbi:MAG TPA: acyl-CoA dehydrogenase family protein [Pseudomonadales bacterium]|nr:acyl-CoA dehydrogenase family protein [Pseudomonadales bacterium]
MTELPQERLTIGAGAISSAEVALERTLEYTKERKVFGKSVADFQYNRFKLAEMATEITIGRSFLNHCIELHVNRQLDAVTAAKLKWWSTELQNRVIDQCLQMHGGFGYMWEFPIARQFADSRVSRIYGGSNEVMKEIIARTL